MFASEWTQPTGKMITMWSVLGQTSSANSYYMNTVYVLPARTLSKKLFLKLNLKLCIKTVPERLEHAL